jgi:hypothetical protein
MARPQPSANPTDPGGYDTSTNVSGIASSHIHTQPTTYMPAPTSYEDHLAPSRSIQVAPNGTVAHVTHAETATGRTAAAPVPVVPNLKQR